MFCLVDRAIRSEPTRKSDALERRWIGAGANLPDRTHGIECAGDNLRRTSACFRVADPGFEQLRVREDDSELIVQPMEKRRKLVRLRRFWRLVSEASGRHPLVAAETADCSWRAGWLASRHRVSVKIRTEPPAVRTYSTFPAAIQL